MWGEDTVDYSIPIWKISC